MNFITNHTLALTPLSPIHIGSGEDIDPTSYVIENGILHQFDTSLADLSKPQIVDLNKIIDTDPIDIKKLQSFFFRNQSTFLPYTHTLLPVVKGVVDQYQGQINPRPTQRKLPGQNNQLAIEQHIVSGGLKKQAYIPGSSLKGMLVTAWVDAINHGRAVPCGTESKVVQDRLGGNFDKSPMRFFKPSDLMPTGDLIRRVWIATNHYKVQRQGQPKGVQTRKDCIEYGQYRALTGSLSLQQPTAARHAAEKLPATSLPSLVDLCHYVNRYHLPRFEQEIQLMLARGVVDKSWVDNVRRLLHGELQPLLQSGRACLVRLGRYCGAESKTLSNVAQIKIMQGHGRQPLFLPQTKTFWLACEQTSGTGGVPFGWALLEWDPIEPLPQLKKWCEQQSPVQLASRQQQLAEQRALAMEAKAEKQREQQQIEQARLAAAIAAQQHQAKLMSLSPQQQQLEHIKEEWARTPKQANTGNPLFNKVYQLLVEAVANPDVWTQPERADLAATFSIKNLEAKFTSLGKKKTDLKQLLSQLH